MSNEAHLGGKLRLLAIVVISSSSSRVRDIWNFPQQFWDVNTEMSHDLIIWNCSCVLQLLLRFNGYSFLAIIGRYNLTAELMVFWCLQSFHPLFLNAPLPHLYFASALVVYICAVHPTISWSLYYDELCFSLAISFGFSVMGFFDERWVLLLSSGIRISFKMQLVIMLV